MSEQPAENLELPEASPYAMWWWDCPECSDTNDNSDIEPSGVMTCEHCQSKVRMS